jgi:hypothetical protein
MGPSVLSLNNRRCERESHTVRSSIKIRRRFFVSFECDIQRASNRGWSLSGQTLVASDLVLAF